MSLTTRRSELIRVKWLAGNLIANLVWYSNSMGFFIFLREAKLSESIKPLTQAQVEEVGTG